MNGGLKKNNFHESTSKSLIDVCINAKELYNAHQRDQQLNGETGINKWNNSLSGVLFHENNDIYHQLKYTGNICKPLTPNIQTETQFRH